MKTNTLKAKILSLFVVLSFGLSFAAKASEEAHGGEEKFDISHLIFHHIGDAHEWHFATIGHTHLSIDLPVILYSADRGLEMFSFSNLKRHNELEPLPVYNGYTTDHDGKIISTEGRSFTNVSITKNVASLFVSVLILFGVFFTIAKAYKQRKGLAPSGIQSFFEPIIVFIRDEIAIPNIGKKYERFLPYLLTVFFFIWINNRVFREQRLLDAHPLDTGHSHVAETHYVACRTCRHPFQAVFADDSFVCQHHSGPCYHFKSSGSHLYLPKLDGGRGRNRIFYRYEFAGALCCHPASLCFHPAFGYVLWSGGGRTRAS
jgi:hypothetical protein